MKRTFLTVTLPVCLTIVIAIGYFATAGDLNPPAGAVSGTMKTLVDVEPRIAINATNTPGDADSLFRIAQRGSYYLTGNITGMAGRHGIEIAASGVTLDLNGFDLQGVAGSLDGVSVTVSNLENIAVVNGSVRFWGDEGVDLQGSIQTNNCRVAGVLASDNTGSGILVGPGGTVTHCAAFQNGGHGIGANLNCMIAHCSANSNAGSGIGTGINCSVSNCSASNNVFFGIDVSDAGTMKNCSTSFNGFGIRIGAGGSVTSCTARSNTGDGITCSSSCLIRGNTSTSNGVGGDGANILATGSDNRIEDNNCTGADRGIDVDAAGNVIIRNTCSGNTTDWVIVANNVVGPILDRRAPASAAINGFAAPDSTGSTHPNANFSY